MTITTRPPRAPRARHRTETLEHGIWSPFRSLLAAQLVGAVLGLVFWVVVARLVTTHDVGVAAAAISAQTLLGMVTVLGLGTLLISELPRHGPLRQRRLLVRSLAVVLVSSVVVGGAAVAASPLLTRNLREALGDPLGAVTFVAGVVAAAWAIVVDEASLGLRRSSVQVGRNLLASSLRFPAALLLLGSGVDDAHVLQLCWVLPLLTSVPVALWRLRPRPALVPTVASTHGDDGPDLRPDLRSDLTSYAGPALRNHALSLSLAAASQLVPVIAGLTLHSVPNAEFAIAWLLATFVFLPPYLLAIALFAHGANVSTEEFRTNMERTIPASLLLSLSLCVGAWVLGEPVLMIFGGHYAAQSYGILALLVPAGLWMVFKDHLVALLRSQRRFGLATRLAIGAVLLETVGAVAGALLFGVRGLCLGWLGAMVLEVALGRSWLHEAFGGLHWQWPAPIRAGAGRRGGHANGRGAARGEGGRVAAHVVGAVALVVVICGVGVWVATRSDSGSGSEPPPGTTTTSTTNNPFGLCTPSPGHPGPLIDLGVQASTGKKHPAQLTYAKVRSLVRLAKGAGASVISTAANFAVMRPVAGQPYRFAGIDRVVGAAHAAGLAVKLNFVGMPRWALDHPSGAEAQPPVSAAELARWTGFVRDVLRHVDRTSDVHAAYAEVWNEPDNPKYWPVAGGPSPRAYDALLAATYDAVHQVSPTTLVVSGGLDGNDIGFLQKMYDGMSANGRFQTPFDLLGVHPFTGDASPVLVQASRRERGPFGTLDHNFLGYRGLRQVLTDHGDGDLPIYISAFGYSLVGSQTTPAVTEDQRATYLTDAYQEVTCDQDVAALSWYYLHPTPWDPASWTLVDRSGRTNATYAALVAWGKASAAARAGS